MADPEASAAKEKLTSILNQITPSGKQLERERKSFTFDRIPTLC
jgi:hypothetical protein